jgi:hypothetical protein
MTPKEKALDLVEDMFNCPETGYNEHKIECALVAVDEIINTLKIFPEKDTTSKSVVNFSVSRIMYWVQVKKEIEKL